MKTAYKTKYGVFYQTIVEDFLSSKIAKKYKNRINLVFTSPPFPLNRKKKYGNLKGQDYTNWLSNFAPIFKDLMTEDGSIVIELGNSWEPKRPIMSVLSLKSLIAFLEKGELNLCQQFIWYNTAKLPSPAQWVNIKRNRVKDAFTHIWWMSKTDFPKANNRNVLVNYSDSMKKLLKTKKYNYGIRPSEHNIGKKSFLKDNSGAIPSNVIVAANTYSNTAYQKYCKQQNIKLHPARMPNDIPRFFIKFLTNPGDIILDPFAGSNTTGAIADELKRKWISLEPNEEYIRGSIGRFSGKRNINYLI